MSEEVTTEPLPAKTTAAEDITHAGQRRINMIWEVTQAIIALAVVMATVSVAVVLALKDGPHREFPDILSSALFLVIGFYFSRTNHTTIGGVGAKPQPKYEGR